MQKPCTSWWQLPCWSVMVCFVLVCSLPYAAVLPGALGCCLSLRCNVLCSADLCLVWRGCNLCLIWRCSSLRRTVLIHQRSLSHALSSCFAFTPPSLSFSLVFLGFSLSLSSCFSLALILILTLLVGVFGLVFRVCAEIPSQLLSPSLPLCLYTPIFQPLFNCFT